MSLVFNMVGGGSKLSKDFCPSDGAEIRESWLPIELNADATPGEEWTGSVFDKQIRADTFMGAIISSQSDYVILPITMVSDGTNFVSDFAAPLVNSDGQCALAEIMISVVGGYAEAITLTVQETFDLSDPTSNLVYGPILYLRPNPT